jgi:hypothetical protein
MSSLQKINIRNSVLILMIVAAVATRLLNINHISDWVTFTPVGAVALFGGTYFKDKWKAFLVPMLTLFISDLALNYAFFHKFVWVDSSSIIVYICFAMMVIIGMSVKKVNVANVLGVSLLSVLVHWLFTDIPVFYGATYAHNLSGYWAALCNAIPFEKSLLMGNLIFGTVLYGGFELAKRKYTVLRTSTKLAV